MSMDVGVLVRSLDGVYVFPTVEDLLTPRPGMGVLVSLQTIGMVLDVEDIVSTRGWEGPRQRYVAMYLISADVRGWSWVHMWEKEG